MNCEMIYRDETTSETVVFEFSTNTQCDDCNVIYGSDPNSHAAVLERTLGVPWLAEVVPALNDDVFFDMIALFSDGSKCSTTVDPSIGGFVLGIV